MVMENESIKEQAEKLYCCLSDLDLLLFTNGVPVIESEEAAVLSMLDRGWLYDDNGQLKLTELGEEIANHTRELFVQALVDELKRRGATLKFGN
jgi:hypothetical protein